MYQKVEIDSFMVTKLKDDKSFTKYDVEASIDEVESEDDHVRLKYRFVLLSNPTNVKISMDGFTAIYGSQQEIGLHLSNDEENIPRVVNTLYQEVFPFLYITAKTMQIPCPAYRLADITKSANREPRPALEQIEESHHDSKLMDDTNPMGRVSSIEPHINAPDEESNSLVEEQKIPTI